MFKESFRDFFQQFDTENMHLKLRSTINSAAGMILSSENKFVLVVLLKIFKLDGTTNGTILVNIINQLFN